MTQKKLTIALAGNANVGKSLSGDTNVFVNYEGSWQITELKDLTKKIFRSSAITKNNDMESILPQNLFVVSLNLNTLKVEKAKITHVIRHKERRKLICLKTSSDRTLTTTQDHNFIILRNGVPKVVDARHLMIGNQVLLVEKLSLEKSKPVLDLNKYLKEKVEADNRQYQLSNKFVVVHGKKIPRFIKIDEDWARFFGLYLAEGCITQSSQVPRITTGEEDVKNFIEKHLKHNNIPYHIYNRSGDKNLYDISISKALTPILQEFGSEAGKKEFPSFVYQWNEELIKALLGSYFRGDGWKQATALHASTKSVKLWLGLIILLAITKKHSRLSFNQVNGTSYYEIRYIPNPSRKRSQWLERIKGIGGLLKQARTATGLTQLEVVRNLGWKSVKGTYISALENERRNTTKKFLQRLVSLYRRYTKGASPSLDLLEKLAFSDVVLDEITEIREVDAEDDYVYDLVVQGNKNFMLANGVFIHNSVIFNYLTGLHQHIGNWPGKTVERAEGTLHFKGYTINVLDLPGIYSLSTFSIEELVSREYIAIERPDLVINIVDASVLERNLLFTLQLIELETPMVIALNQMDMAKKKGIKIDVEKLESALGIPVVPTVAIKGTGLFKLLEKALDVIEGRAKTKPMEIRYGKEVEKKITKIARMVEKAKLRYPPRYVAVKLLEGDEEVKREVNKKDAQIAAVAEKLAGEIEVVHGHPCATLIASERCEITGLITREVQRFVPPIKPTMGERIHAITTHRILGYPIMVISLLTVFYCIFTVGDYTAELLEEFFYSWKPLFESLLGTGTTGKLIWGGIVEGFIAGIMVALPYIVPFYFMLYVLEDSGYLSRIAFLMDNVMHKIGLHGKAFIPLMLGYGCNVPACLGCRIMETERERFLAAFATTLIPCAARTVIIFGLVGEFIGIQWALMLYLIDLLVIFVLGRLAFKILPGEPTALIMEMPDYRVPHLKTVLKQTWFRLEEFIKIAFPLIIVSSLAIKLLEVTGLLGPIAAILSPITVTWLGLPAIAGVTLIFGVLRKELTLIMLATLLGTTNFAQVLTPSQMVVFTLVTMFYIPCIATIAALIKEFGWRRALIITVFEIAFAILVGGVALRLLTLAGI